MLEISDYSFFYTLIKYIGDPFELIKVKDQPDTYQVFTMNNVRTVMLKVYLKAKGEKEKYVINTESWVELLPVSTKDINITNVRIDYDNDTTIMYYTRGKNQCTLDLGKISVLDYDSYDLDSSETKKLFDEFDVKPKDNSVEVKVQTCFLLNRIQDIKREYTTRKGKAKKEYLYDSIYFAYDNGKLTISAYTPPNEKDTIVVGNALLGYKKLKLDMHFTIVSFYNLIPLLKLSQFFTAILSKDNDMPTCFDIVCNKEQRIHFYVVPRVATHEPKE